MYRTKGIKRRSDFASADEGGIEFPVIVSRMQNGCDELTIDYNTTMITRNPIIGISVKQNVVT